MSYARKVYLIHSLVNHVPYPCVGIILEAREKTEKGAKKAVIHKCDTA